MDIDEAFAQLFQDNQRYRCIVDESATLTCGCNLTTHDAFGIILNLVLLKEFLEPIACNIESTFDNTFSSTGAYGCCLGALAREQANGTKQNRLTGTCLTSNNREAFGKL